MPWKISIHPSLAEGFTEAQLTHLQKIESQLDRPLPPSTFYSLMTDMPRMPADNHTEVIMPEELRGPELPLIWLETGLYAYADIHNPGDSEAALLAGDQLVAIADVPIDGAITILEHRVVNTESRTDTRSQPPGVLFSDTLLSPLGVPADSAPVPVTVLRHQEIVETALARFGDDGTVIRRFADPPQYQLSSADDRLFPWAPSAFSGQPMLDPEPVADTWLQFEGTVYILTSPWTGSAANWFVTLTKEHGWGTIVGEPTGVVPSGKYGNPVALSTPQLGWQLRISSAQFVLENHGDGTYVRSVTPDALVRTSIDDILERRDPQMAYVTERVRETLDS